MFMMLSLLVIYKNVPNRQHIVAGAYMPVQRAPAIGRGGRER